MTVWLEPASLRVIPEAVHLYRQPAIHPRIVLHGGGRPLADTVHRLRFRKQVDQRFNERLIVQPAAII